MVFFLKRFRVSEESMLPGIKPGDYIIVDTLRYKLRSPKNGDIIVFRHDGMEMVKRISANDGGSYTVLGDNLNKSVDSRRFGPIKKRDVVGKVIWIAK
jgi:nickel-type superoxide dismutase maturation protease